MKLDTFFDNFGLLADAPNGVQKLREMILQLAVQGKLVPQNPKDEHASVLLKKIKAEKERLIKEGKTKKAKPLPPIKSDETPYALPNSWKWVRFGEIIDLISGQHIKSADYNSNSVGIAYLTGPSDFGDVHPIIAKWTKKPKTVAIKNDILLTVKGAGLGKNNIVDVDKVAISRQLMAIRCNDVDYSYIHLFINSKYSYFQSIGVGIAIPGISRENVLTLVSPLPPFNEQKRIVAKVDELMALCDELEARKQKVSINCIQLNDASIHKLLTAREPKIFSKHWQRICNNFNLLYYKPENVTKLRQAVLQLAIQGKLVPQDPKDEPASVLLDKIKAEKKRLIKEKKIKKMKALPSIDPDEIPYAVPTGWEWEKTERLCFVTKLAGFEYTKYINLSDFGEVPVIRAQNVRRDRIDGTNLKYIDLETSQSLTRSALTRPSILMTFIGAGIGDVAIFNKRRRWHLAPNVAKLEPFNFYSENIDIRYLLHYLMSEVGRIEIFKHRKATAQPSLSMATIRDINVAIPPLGEQKRIVAKVDELMSLCDELETRLSKSQTDCDRLMEAAVADILAA